MGYISRPRKSYIYLNMSRGTRRRTCCACGIRGCLIEEVTARNGTHDSDCSIISVFLLVRCARGVIFLELFAASTHRGDARRYHGPKRDLSR